MKRSKQMSESIELGILLALSGGLMDAYSYIYRDHVFANAQTGNILLFGIQLAEKNWTAASAWDCTGLIPSAPSSSAELESYEAIYPFEPPKLDSNESGATKYSSAYTGEKQE